MDEYEMEQHRVTAAELIAKLQAMPPDARVVCIYDGFCKVSPDHVWLSRGGHVVLVDERSPVYRDEDRPDWAPPETADNNWWTPERTA